MRNRSRNNETQHSGKYAKREKKQRPLPIHMCVEVLRCARAQIDFDMANIFKSNLYRNLYRNWIYHLADHLDYEVKKDSSFSLLSR